MSKVPSNSSPVPPSRGTQPKGMRRLLWLLVIVLVLVAALNLFLSIVLPGMVQRWLHERGLEAQVQHIDVSLPRLHAHLRGVEVRNEFERGFRVREGTLGLSWWHLLRGKIHVKLVELDGAYMDLESEPGERGRVWEIGGWRLGEGEKTPKNWRVDLTAATVRDSVVCYQHKPQWDSPSCVRIGKLVLDDFFVSGFREAEEALKFDIGADDLMVEGLLAWDEFPGKVSRYSLGSQTQEPGEGDMQRSPEENPTLVLVHLQTQNIRFARPGNELAIDEVFARKFAGCPPDRWAAAVPALNRINGHCATARRLELRGAARFAFGKESEIAWHRLSGEEVRLRYRNRRFPNWHAQTIAINSFDFLRDKKSLIWQSAGATGFSWCPNPWRADAHHYCIKAGTLRLPKPTVFNWLDGFNADLSEATLAQGTVEDLDAPKPHPTPLNINQLRIGALQYRNNTRRLYLEDTQLDAASGCVPGDLWDRADPCVTLSQLQLAEDFSLQLPRKVAGKGKPAQSWALDSGPLTLARLRLQSGAGASNSSPEKSVDLRSLNWARMEIAPDKKEIVAEDFALKSLSGCVPDGVLPQRLSPLCTRLEQLQGEGNFIVRGGDSGGGGGKGEGESDDGASTPYVILGELALDSLLLSDHLTTDPDRQTGLALTHLRIGPGFFRRAEQQLQAGEYFAAGQGHWWLDDEPGAATDLPAEQEGKEKGLFAQDVLSAGGAESSPGESDVLTMEHHPIGKPVRASSTELELEKIALESLQGCLPAAWQLLLTSGTSERRPRCFDIRNLQQQQPLQLQLEQRRLAGTGEDSSENNMGARGEKRSAFRLGFTAAELTLEGADIETAAGKSLLAVNNLQLPKAKVHLQSAPTLVQLDLPGATLDGAAFCLQADRCVQVETLRTGDTFVLDYRRRHFHADLNQLALAHFSLTGSQKDFTADVRDLSSLSMRVDLPRTAPARAQWQLEALQAARIDFCWPAAGDPERLLPQCVRGRGFRSNGSGVAVAELALHRELPQLTSQETSQEGPSESRGGQDSPAQIALGALSIARVGLVQTASGPVALNLQDIQLDSVRGCGPRDWLAAARLRGEKSARWGGCLDLGKLRLKGDNLVALGRGAGSGARGNLLELGPLQADQLQLLPANGASPTLQLAHLQWQSLRWPGGVRVQVEDMIAQDFSGCLPDASGAVDRRRDPVCVTVGQVQISGRQKLEAGGAEPAFRTTGRIAIEDFALRQGSRERMAFSHLAVRDLIFSPDALELQRGEMSGLSGCVQPVQWSDKPLSPCFEVGKISIQSEHRLVLADFRSHMPQRYFRNVRVDGLRVTQKGFPSGLPAELLHVESLQAEQLGFGSRQLISENLQLNNISSCVPKGYIPGVRHCVNVENLTTTGNFSFAERLLQLDMAQLHRLTVLDVAGDQLLETEFAEAHALRFSRERISLSHAEVANSKLFRRDERAQEFVNHQWNTEIQLFAISQFEYLPKQKQLEIDRIELLKPRSILARGVEGDLGAWERFRSETPEADRYRYRRGDLAREANRFQYRIREIYVDRGRFLWLDNTNEYEAKLPIRRINLLLQGVSNYHQDPPALLVFNARPGGFSEMHLAGHVDLLDNNHWNSGLLGYVEGANLIPTTPYIARLLGYKILQGQLDAVVNVAVDDNQVDALAQMDLQKIKVRRVKDTDHLQVKKSFIPLGLALALLKDGDGDVRFKMPVSGELYDPKFNFSFIFSDLLQRAILESLFAYFTPVGFYSLGKLAWARFRAERFDDLEFAPGNDTLSEVARAELNGMIETMRDNPQARPGICGVATTQDLRVMFPHEVQAMSASRDSRSEFFRDPPRGMREDLLRLSNRRSRHVQKFLIEAGLDQEDFIQCAPDYIGTDDGPPRVEFSN